MKLIRHLLKKSINCLLKPLVDIFNQSIYTEEIPDIWKLANIMPIFKKGSKSELGNYRPVSLTSQICKIMERIIKDEIVSFLEKKWFNI